MRAIVLTSQRTGSVFLQQCLDSHPQVRCYGEILLGYGGLSDRLPPAFLKRHRRLRTLWQYVMSGAAIRPVRTMDRIFESVPEADVVAFRVMYNQMDRDRRVAPYLTRDESLKVVHLVRDDAVRQYVSLHLMHNQAKLGRYEAHTKSKLPPKPLPIDPQAALRGMRLFEQKKQEYRDRFSAHPMLEISYESMIEDGQMTADACDRLCGFLEVEPQQLTASIVKMNPSELSQMISNYDEFAEVIGASEFGERLAVSV